MKAPVLLITMLAATSITAYADSSKIPKETKLPQKDQIEEAKHTVTEILVSAPWTIIASGDHKGSYKVSLGTDGVATRSDTKQKWWKWKIDGNILRCEWFTSGWVNFEIKDDPTKKAWKERNRAGDYYTMILSPPK